MARRLLTFDELAEELGVRRSTVERWARQGRIPKVQASAKIVRFDLDDVIDALKGYSFRRQAKEKPGKG